MIKIVHDPYKLGSDTCSLFVDSAKLRKNTFSIIDKRLRGDNSDNAPILLVGVATPFWRQFLSAYSDVKSILFIDISPRSCIQAKAKQALPEWLTNDLIDALGLCQIPQIKSAEEEWNSWVLKTIFPSIHIDNYKDWLLAAFECDLLSNEIPDELKNEFKLKLALLLVEIPLDKLVVNQIINIVDGASTLHQALELMLLSPAIKPLLKLDCSMGENICADFTLAETLPLIFPLPEPLHKRVSSCFVSFIKNSRLSKSNFSTTMFSLNANWDGVSDELRLWLQTLPSGLTKSASNHLKHIPQNEGKFSLQNLINLFSPIDPPYRDWSKSHFDQYEHWYHEYTIYMRNAFSRRVLPETWDDDPAKGFSDWLQSESMSIYNDLDNSFVKVSRMVKDALNKNKQVVLCMLDAFASHLEDLLISQFSEALSAKPSTHRYLFSPVPTLTEINKKSVLTGMAPAKCMSALEPLILQVYSLDSNELLIAKEWQDIGRVQPHKEHRLIVYLDNRIDDSLNNQKSYLSLREESNVIIHDIAQRMKLWSDDLFHLNGMRPEIYVTADHGFTFAPPASKGGLTVETLGNHRCFGISDDKTKQKPHHLAYLDKSKYHIPKPYLAATKRSLEHGTISGWFLQHGGLLPEEVVIPFLSWFGQEQKIHFSEIELPDKIEKENDKWKLVAHIKNTSALVINKTKISLRVIKQPSTTHVIGNLLSGETRKVEYVLDNSFPAVAEQEELCIIINQQMDGKDAPEKRVNVIIKRVLMEPDHGFESMF